MDEETRQALIQKWKGMDSYAKGKWLAEHVFGWSKGGRRILERESVKSDCCCFVSREKRWIQYWMPPPSWSDAEVLKSVRSSWITGSGSWQARLRRFAKELRCRIGSSGVYYTEGDYALCAFLADRNPKPDHPHPPEPEVVASAEKGGE